MFGEPMVQDPATTIRVLREKLLDALRREKAALDQAETLRAEVAAKDAEIKRLNDVIGEMSE
jgi:flagellin-specific chaperone FliS